VKLIRNSAGAALGAQFLLGSMPVFIRGPVRTSALHPKLVRSLLDLLYVRSIGYQRMLR
jgi:hypothetical protein